MRFGQVVIGGAGTGKSTLVLGMSDLLTQLKRPYCLVNLDCGNGNPPYKPDIDIRNLLTLDSAAALQNLGPNGALMFSFDQLLVDIEWLQDEISRQGDKFFIFDLPGQIELFTHSTLVQQILEILRIKMRFSLVTVNLVDSVLCTNRSAYVSALLSSLSTGIRLDTPHVNVLTKIDLVRGFKEDMQLGLRSYLSACAEGSEGTLFDCLFTEEAVHPFDRKFLKMSQAICAVVEEYGQSGFLPLAVEDKNLMLRLLAACDRACGFAANNADAMSLSDDLAAESYEDYFASLEEKYLESHACAACGAVEVSKRCSRCKKIYYCDAECQAAHWKASHRLSCKTWKFFLYSTRNDF